jgi:hypothetical protein
VGAIQQSKEQATVKIVNRMVLGLGVVILAASAMGQGITTGTITGTVTDPSGALFPAHRFKSLIWRLASSST